MPDKIYYLIIYDNSFPKGVSAAKPSILNEHEARVLFQEQNPTIERKKENKKYQVTSKRLFEYKNTDGSLTLFIICDADRIK